MEWDYNGGGCLTWCQRVGQFWRGVLGPTAKIVCARTRKSMNCKKSNAHPDYGRKFDETVGFLLTVGPGLEVIDCNRSNSSEIAVSKNRVSAKSRQSGRNPDSTPAVLGWKQQPLERFHSIVHVVSAGHKNLDSSMCFWDGLVKMGGGRIWVPRMPQQKTIPLFHGLQHRGKGQNGPGKTASPT